MATGQFVSAPVSWLAYADDPVKAADQVFLVSTIGYAATIPVRLVG